MTDHTLPPLRSLPASRLESRKQHLVAEIAHAPRRPTRRVGALVVVVGLLVAGTAIAATTNWLTGTPAPNSVVDDFGSYTPQLGFNPDPGSAVLVAEDGGIRLYATSNKQGSYCLVASAPWKRPSKLPDGGTCIAPAQAAAPLIAGLVGASSAPDGMTLLIAGRTADPEARTVSFTDPDGNPITRPVGTSGFFVAEVHTVASPCAAGDWNSSFSVLGADGNERTHTTVTLAFAHSNTPGACGFAAPHP